MGHIAPTVVALALIILLQEVMPIPIGSTGARRDKRSPCPDPCQRRDSRGICRLMFSCRSSSKRLDPNSRRPRGNGIGTNSQPQVFNANIFNAPTNGCPGTCQQRDRFDVCRVNFSCIVGRR